MVRLSARTSDELNRGRGERAEQRLDRVRHLVDVLRQPRRELARRNAVEERNFAAQNRLKMRPARFQSTIEKRPCVTGRTL